MATRGSTFPPRVGAAPFPVLDVGTWMFDLQGPANSLTAGGALVSDDFTYLAVATIDAGGNDCSTALAAVAVDDVMALQDPVHAASWMTAKVAASVTDGTVYEFDLAEPFGRPWAPATGGLCLITTGTPDNPGSTDLCTVADVEALGGVPIAPADTARVERLIQMASALVRSACWPIPWPVPAQVAMVTAQLVIRQIANPTENNNEQVGTYQVSYHRSTLRLGDADLAALGAWARVGGRVASVQLTAPMLAPLPADYWAWWTV